MLKVLLNRTKPYSRRLAFEHENKIDNKLIFVKIDIQIVVMRTAQTDNEKSVNRNEAMNLANENNVQNNLKVFIEPSIRIKCPHMHRNVYQTVMFELIDIDFESVVTP